MTTTSHGLVLSVEAPVASTALSNAPLVRPRRSLWLGRCRRPLGYVVQPELSPGEAGDAHRREHPRTSRAIAAGSPYLQAISTFDPTTAAPAMTCSSPRKGRSNRLSRRAARVQDLSPARALAFVYRSRATPAALLSRRRGGAPL